MLCRVQNTFLHIGVKLKVRPAVLRQPQSVFGSFLVGRNTVISGGLKPSGRKPCEQHEQIVPSEISLDHHKGISITNLDRISIRPQ